MSEERGGRLTGKVAIVTGGARGLGRAEAELLAAEGAAVIVVDPGVSLAGDESSETPAEEVARSIAERGGTALASQADCADWPAAEGLVETALSNFGRLDIIVNSAGILRERMIFNMGPTDWDEVVRVHLTGHVATVRYAASYWRDRFKRTGEGGGRIINTTSEAGLLGTTGQSNYVAAKGAVAALTLAEARELAPYGVTANAIAPRAATRMTAAMTGLPGGEAEAEELMARTMAPEDIAALVAYLASAEAQGITGQILIAFDGKIQLADTFARVATVERPAPWKVDEMPGTLAELFSDRPSAIGPPDF
jgi:NAD(P)-dependent dehydrogenase (short-subunit alcohol dehydrogenase family)